MRLLDRYLGRVVRGAIGINVAVLLCLFTLFEFVERLKDLGRGGYDLSGVAISVAARIPRLCYELFPLAGSYIPFSQTEAARSANGDPRKAIAERYRDRADFLGQVEAAGEALAVERYLLAADVAAIVERAAQHWDLLMGP